MKVSTKPSLTDRQKKKLYST